MSISTESNIDVIECNMPISAEQREKLTAEIKWLQGNVRQKIAWFTTPPNWLINKETGEERLCLYSFDSFCPLQDADDLRIFEHIDLGLNIIIKLIKTNQGGVREAICKLIEYVENNIGDEAKSCRVNVYQILCWYNGFAAIHKNGL
ncbi:hypothetical protein HN512_04140 [Candidatus Peregrinibacteria bacterium]|jgi:hypothetical protein|nr:hypothetical protein [Candidatus Peregrinibacteria bacterium]MBT3598999.1 hypothetical protein [Candidatus Peregrinibacteria bacterium]MBT4366969.1 hypothetical protein [Candidatus Peregrinibacteria bacterium]MBT4585564.1 hypothetical protein [Candidatus Peregrinibacteria bacterium]MBT6731290.1 hypothetical protein [Candidatus Peregrinibacteria bacterium]